MPHDPKIPDPYARSTYHGKTLDNATIAAIKRAEKMLGYELTIVQGIGGAPASAGTHVDGRSVDLLAWDWRRKVRVLKRVGFAVWYRRTLPGVWAEHLHAVLIFESVDNSRGVALSAFRQIGSFLRKRDGLKYDGPDPEPWRVTPQPVYTLAQYRNDVLGRPIRPTNVSRARDQLALAIHRIDRALAGLDKVAERRRVVVAQRAQLRVARRALRGILRSLPKA